MPKKKVTARKKKDLEPIVIPSEFIEGLQMVTDITQKYWPGCTGGVSRLDDGTWVINTNGYEWEKLGKTPEEIEAFCQANPPRTKEGELQKFKDKILQEMGVDLNLL